MIVPSRTTGLGLLLTAGAGAALGACSLAVDFAECRSDADCYTMLPGGVEWNCVDGTCVEPTGNPSTSDGSATVDPTHTTPPTTGSSSGDDSSTGPVSPTTSDGTSSTGGEDTSSSSDTGVVACTLNTECEAALGDGNLCVDGTCISALSDECQQLIWPSQGSHDKVVLLASIIPASPPFDAIT